MAIFINHFKDIEDTILIENLIMHDNSEKIQLELYCAGRQAHDESTRVKFTIRSGPDKDKTFYIPFTKMKFDSNNLLLPESILGEGNKPTKINQKYIKFISPVMLDCRSEFEDRFNGKFDDKELGMRIGEKHPDILIGKRKRGNKV